MAEIPRDATVESCRDAILSLLAERKPGASICPSEAARRAFGADESAWRAGMVSVREAAKTLAAERLVEATQRGTPCDLNTVRGPIRLRLCV